ncbi:MAG: DUF4143 domain-containing protein [bacterium]
MLHRKLTAPRQSFFLLGPRGSGKSTWLRAEFPDAHSVDLHSEATYQSFLAEPDLFAAELRAVDASRWVVVDEVQRLPNLLNEVHRFMEERRMRFVLCGSSARKLKRADVNLLAGRALKRTMHPFIPAELAERFDLHQALRFGLLPIVWDSSEPEETLAAYTQLYLREEIQAEAVVRNLPGFSRFLPIAAICHGQAVNVTNMAREAGIARTTAIGYLDILEDTLLCFRVPGLEAKLRVRERKHPKWYWCDPGLVRAMKHSAGPVLPEEKGALFEGLVAQLLRAYRDYAGICDEISYWSAGGRDTEVDFVLARGTERIAIEVKSGRRFQERWCRGLRAIAPLDGLVRRLIVYPEGPTLRTEDGIDVMSLELFSELISGETIWTDGAF